jgi:hypothetical protein
MRRNPNSGRLNGMLFHGMMRVMSRSLWPAAALAAALFAAACAQIGSVSDTADASRRAVVTAVIEAVRSDDATRRRVLAEARIAQRSAPDAEAPRARLGLLLALLPAPLANTREAEVLLTPLAANSDGPWSEVASVALAGIAQQQRIDARARLAETRAADAERAGARAVEHARRIEARAAEAEARAAEAERKLEAMKAIERRVLEREVPSDPRRR